MSQELLYTSAPRGLKPGSRGFCTVLSTQGMPAPLASAVEGLSGYRPIYPPNDERAARNPVVYSHLKMQAAGRTWHVLSRIADYGLDYSQRPNKLAHHVILDNQAEQLPGGPANLLAMSGFMREEWEGEPKIVAQKPVTREPRVHVGVCERWKEVTGDAGWAGVVAESFLRDPDRLVILLFEPGQEILPLFAEVLSLLSPEKRWNATFSTYFTGLATGTTCLWRAMIHDSKEAHESLRFVSSLRIDLTADSLGAASGGELVEAARSGERTTTKAQSIAPPRRPELLGETDSTTSEETSRTGENQKNIRLPALPSVHPQFGSQPSTFSYAPAPPKLMNERKIADHVEGNLRGLRKRRWLLITRTSLILALLMSIGIGGRYAWFYMGNLFVGSREFSEALIEDVKDSTSARADVPIQASSRSTPDNRDDIRSPTAKTKPATTTGELQPPAAKEERSQTTNNTDSKPVDSKAIEIPQQTPRADFGNQLNKTANISNDPKIDFASLPNPTTPAKDAEPYHTFDWPNNFKMPTPEDLHSLAINPNAWRRPPNLPDSNVLLAPRWLKWKQRSPIRSDPPTSILCFFEPTQAEPKDAQQFAFVLAKSDPVTRKIEYILRRATNEGRLAKSNYLRWCAVQVNDSGQMPRPLRRVFFSTPYSVPTEQRHFRKDLRSLSWKIGLPIDHQSQPDLFVDEIVINIDGRQYETEAASLKDDGAQTFVFSKVAHFVAEQLGISDCKDVQLKIQRAMQPGDLDITLTLSEIFNESDLLADARAKLNSQRLALAKRLMIDDKAFENKYRDILDSLKQCITTLGEVRNPDTSPTPASVRMQTSMDQLDKKVGSVEKVDLRDTEVSALSKLQKMMEPITLDVNALEVRYMSLSAIEAAFRDVVVVSAKISFNLYDVSADKDPIKHHIVRFDAADAELTKRSGAKP